MPLENSQLQQQQQQQQHRAAAVFQPNKQCEATFRDKQTNENAKTETDSSENHLYQEVEELWDNRNIHSHKKQPEASLLAYL